MKNWKTTAAGAAAILGALADLATQASTNWDMTRLMADGTAIATGVGLLFAKDMNVTGGDVRQ